MIWLRRAGAGDIPAMFDIRTGVRENHQSRAELEAIGVRPEAVALLLDGPGAGWMAGRGTDPGRPLGFSIAIGRDASLFALFVRPEAEGLGLGRALLTAAEDWLFALHPQIWLTTGAGPALRAQGFYRRMGWAPVRTEADGQIRYEKRSAFV